MSDDGKNRKIEVSLVELKGNILNIPLITHIYIQDIQILTKTPPLDAVV